MPDYFSHLIGAEKIYEALRGDERTKIVNKNLYLLGAQGGDVFFTYNLKLTKSNLGKEIHLMDAEQLFRRLILGNMSYAAGFAAHYAFDAVLHPAIYAYERTKRSPYTHPKFERDLGLFVSRKYGMRRTILPRDAVLACTYAVYDTVKHVEPRITVTGVERCLKRHFNYSRYMFTTKKQTFKCAYDFSTLSSAIEDAVTYGAKCVSHVLAGDIDPEVFDKQFLQR